MKQKNRIEDNLGTRFGSQKTFVYHICNNVSPFKNFMFEHAMKNANSLSRMHEFSSI